MTWIALAATLSVAPGATAAAPGWFGGRVLTLPRLHVGVRPAAFLDDEGDRSSLEWGAGATVQVSADVL